MDGSILTADHIHKTYNGRDVLTDACLDVHMGETVALVGENGCGKSTLLRVLCGVTSPDGGNVRALPDVRPAFIPDRFEKINMSVARFLDHMRQLENAEPKAIDRYAAMFSMSAHMDTPLRFLSKGMLQKVAVIQALLAERDILFMDEPLSGQDAVSQLSFADEIRRRKKNGMAVVMACHEPFMIEMLADRVLQIKDGVLIDGTDYITKSARPRCVILAMTSEAACDVTVLLNEALPEAHPDITPCGQMMRIEADRSFGPALLSFLLSRSIRIVKYEEAS
jgi:ABC-type multidrug transport system ATPase subunit